MLSSATVTVQGGLIMDYPNLLLEAGIAASEIDDRVK
jgi:hypothetical protein